MTNVHIVAALGGRGSHDLVDAKTGVVLVTATGKAQAYIAAIAQKWVVLPAMENASRRHAPDR